MILNIANFVSLAVATIGRVHPNTTLRIKVEVLCKCTHSHCLGPRLTVSAIIGIFGTFGVVNVIFSTGFSTFLVSVNHFEQLLAIFTLALRLIYPRKTAEPRLTCWHGASVRFPWIENRVARPGLAAFSLPAKTVYFQ